MRIWNKEQKYKNMCPIKKYIMLSCKIKILKKSESINDAKILSIIFAFFKLYVCKFKIYTKGSILDKQHSTIFQCRSVSRWRFFHFHVLLLQINFFFLIKFRSFWISVSFIFIFDINFSVCLWNFNKTFFFVW